MVFTGRLFSLFRGTFYLKHKHKIKVEAGSSMFLSTVDTHLPGSWCHGQEHYNMNLHCPKHFIYSYAEHLCHVLRMSYDEMATMI
jgi:hypothetical protein